MRIIVLFILLLLFSSCVKSSTLLADKFLLDSIYNKKEKTNIPAPEYHATYSGDTIYLENTVIGRVEIIKVKDNRISYEGVIYQVYRKNNTLYWESNTLIYIWPSMENRKNENGR